MTRPSIPFWTAARAALELAESATPQPSDGSELQRLDRRMRQLADRLEYGHAWAQAWADIEAYVKLSGIDLEVFRVTARAVDRAESAAVEELERYTARLHPPRAPAPQPSRGRHEWDGESLHHEWSDEDPRSADPTWEWCRQTRLALDKGCTVE